MCVTVMKVLKKLQDNNCKVVYNKNYDRINLPQKDTFNMFKANDEVCITKMNLLSSSTEANVSIRNIMPGVVKMHPMDAKEAGFDTNEVKAIKYISQSVIKDGKLNIEKLNVIVDEPTLKTLNKVKGLVVKTGEAKDGGIKAQLDLTVIPVAESKLSDLDIMSMVKKVNSLTIDKKIIEYILPTEENKTYDEAQIAMLNKYGVNNGVYQGIKVETNPDNEEVKTYTAKEIKFSIKGVSSIPSIKSIVTDKVPTRGLRKLIYDRYIELNSIPQDSLKAMYYNIEKELKYFKIRLINAKIVKVNNGAISAEITDGVDTMNISIRDIEKEYA